MKSAVWESPLLSIDFAPLSLIEKRYKGSTTTGYVSAEDKKRIKEALGRFAKQEKLILRRLEAEQKTLKRIVVGQKNQQRAQIGFRRLVQVSQGLQRQAKRAVGNILLSSDISSLLSLTRACIALLLALDSARTLTRVASSAFIYAARGISGRFLVPLASSCLALSASVYSSASTLAHAIEDVYGVLRGVKVEGVESGCIWASVFSSLPSGEDVKKLDENRITDIVVRAVWRLEKERK